MNETLSPSAQKVQNTLHAQGFNCTVVELPASTRTAQEAADACGCTLGQIVKSLIFRGKSSGQAVLALVSGSNRVSEARLAQVLGEAVEKADGDFVRAQTGFAIGGVPPLGHIQALRTVIDADLLQYDHIWAAAGTPHAVFQLSAASLQPMTGGQVAEIKQAG